MSDQPILLDAPASIDTPRLHMRVPQAGDGALVYPAVLESLPGLRRFIGAVPWVAEEPAPHKSEAWARGRQADFVARRDFAFLLLDRAEPARVLGVAGLHRPEWSVPRLEVGYWCRSGVQGRGYITEAVAALVAYGFAQLHAQRLELIVDVANTASRRVAERCGFTLEGTHRHTRRDAATGELRDLCVYARLRGEAPGT